MTCRYSEMFGIPGEGAHKPRIFGLAVVDLGLTALAAGLAVYKIWGGDWFPVRFVLAFFATILVAVVFHEAFCVRTQLNDWIFRRAPWGVDSVTTRASP